ncbi:R3H domain-containing protein 1-like isoform X4 [Odontomachus brunneus]|uniref:R3H domain-containing protein 1-like isoform X4 n=1 Tax=Odontomachus brunneus TaxID=486640 RepID=UPI0013F21F76|nr:R3H domain-containing protein 1-like isoform X4 [Odontomachus brunneus]
MARLEIPSIVVYKGSRSQDRPESPTVVVRGGMPSLPSSRQGLAVSGSGAPHQNASESDMIDGNANPNIGTAPASNSLHHPAPSCPPDKSDTESKNFRNRTNTKLKLLVRSHAMRESTSPPREPHNGPPSPHSPQSADAEKKIVCSLSPNPTGAKLNNNESMFNSNLCPAQSPKQMRHTATSPTCRAPSRNGQSSPSQVHSPKNITSPTNGNKLENHRSKITSSNIIQKCNNCVKNNQSDRPGLLQTPVSPSKSGQALQHSPKSTNLAPNAQNNQHKSEQRRPNTLNICNNQCSAQCGNTLSVNRPASRHKLRHQNSSQGSYDSASPCLSRDSSTELYTDSTGIDLEQFIAETINRNQKDRTVLLKIEKDLIEFAKDRQKVSHKFPNMSSYNRMLVHRVSAYFGMEHNVDQSGLSVIVTRTKNMRIPDTRFKEHIRDDLILSEEPRRSILKRDSSSFEDSFNFKSPDRLSGDYCRRSKSFEEREEEYERARRRIFKDSSGESSEITSWPWSSSESSDASARYRLLHPSDHLIRQNRLLKGESFDGRDSFRGAVLRPSVSKSFSFGGYTKGMLSRGDSVTSTHSAGARLMKQDSGASMCSRLSPSSSGYKSQSQRSDATISPSPSPSPVATMTCSHTQVSSQDLASPESNGQTVMWAVTSISSVPPGSIIINPQTNQPYTNADGSIYRFDPDNPPKFFTIENENGNLSSNSVSKHAELTESSRTTNSSCKNDGKKQRSQSKMNVANTTTQVTNTATSPSLPFTPPPPPPPPPPQNPPIPQQQPQQQQQQQQQQQPPPPPPQPQQSLVKSSPTVQTCSHNQTAQPYATYVPTSEPYNQGVYPPPMGQPTVMMAPHPTQGQASVQNGGQGDVLFNQNQLYANYAVPMHQGPQSGDVAELSGYFLGMNIYDQRGGGDNHSTPPHSYPQPPTNQTVQNVQTVQPNYWQPPPNQIPPQQTMYFVPPPGTTISVGQNPGDRQQLHQQQRFPTNYSFNAQTMTPPSQANSNYVGSYPVPYNSVPAVTPSPGDYTYQPPVHMVPTYYPPGQPAAMQPPPVMYRVPTPPNTPTSNQIPGMPLMYVNSSSYAPPVMSGGTFGHHQVAHNGTSPAPPGAYMASTLVPNLVFRQNVPVVPGVRATTPGNSQRASRSPTPAHELFGSGNGDRSAQPQPRYPLPMYQGVHIVPGDMRLMHPGVPTNSRLQYAPVSSPPVVQGCPRPYRPPSYSSNTSGGGTPTSFDGRNQKIRKQRSKVATLPPTGARPNLYQAPSVPSLAPNVPKDIREGTVKVTITRRNQLVQY